MEVGVVLLQLLIAAASGLIVSGTILAVGGLGVLRSFNLRLANTEDDLERLQGRFDRKVKTEASIQGVARRTSERDLKDEATRMLAESNRRQGPAERPKVVGA